VIGTKRRKCLDHLIIFSKAALYRQVKSFVAYYHDTEHISRWPRTRWSRGPSSQQKSDGSLLSRKSAVCITGMSGAPPEKAVATLLVGARGALHPAHASVRSPDRERPTP
jgi:hypothetical protein